MVSIIIYQEIPVVPLFYHHYHVFYAITRFENDQISPQIEASLQIQTMCAHNIKRVRDHGHTKATVLEVKVTPRCTGPHLHCVLSLTLCSANGADNSNLCGI